MKANTKAVKINAVRGALAVAATMALAACGGGESSSSVSSSVKAATVAADQSIVAVTRADAQRLLEEGAFGPTEADIANVQALGIPGWINQQIATPATGYPGFFYVDPFRGATCTTEANIVAKATDPLMIKYCSRDYYGPAPIQRAFFTNALKGKDQLRQRVAFALSQIFVTSGYEAYAQADYQNMLLNDAFVNFKTLLTDITLHPTMGDWLDMVDNDKPDPTKGTQANENYAREFMQLFTVGPNMLNQDGSFQLDSNGHTIPVYNQAQVTALARAFTGWAYPPVGTPAAWNDGVNHAGKMVAFDSHHDMDTKTIISGQTLPAGQGAQADLDAAITAVFNHSNVGPFIVRQLIQKLVLSNPSPAYVQRVVGVFNNNGAGVRGDMGAVVGAILTDTEARGDNKTASDYGKLREPAVYMASILRTLGGTTDGVGPSYWASQQGQPVFQSPSVFNFYSPSYIVPGTTLNGPEFGILDTSSQLNRSNFVVQILFTGGVAADTTVTGSIGTHVNMLANFGAFTDRGATVDKFNDVLMHGTLTAAGKAGVMKYLNALSDAQITSSPTMLSANTAYLLLTSPMYEIEK